MFDAILGFFLHLVQILILEALAWAMLWHFGSGWHIKTVISLLLTVAQPLQCTSGEDMEFFLLSLHWYQLLPGPSRQHSHQYLTNC